MENDLALPPNRKKPKGSNHYKKPKAENRYKAVAVPARAKKQEKQEGLSSGTVVMAIGAGLVLAWLATMEAKGGGGTAKPRHTLGPMVGAHTIKVNSLNGEPLYARTRSSGGFPDGWGDPSSTIVRAADGVTVGMYCGQSYQPTPFYPRLIRIYGRTPDGVEFNAWIQENQTNFISPGYDTRASVDEPSRRPEAIVTDPTIVQAVRALYA
jgi:hypothetical protein